MHIICTSSSLTFTMPTRLMFYSAKIAIVLAKFPISLYLVWRPHTFCWNKYDNILDIWSFYPPLTWKYNDETFKQRKIVGKAISTMLNYVGCIKVKVQIVIYKSMHFDASFWYIISIGLQTWNHDSIMHLNESAYR